MTPRQILWEGFLKLFPLSFTAFLILNAVTGNYGFSILVGFMVLIILWIRWANQEAE